MCIYRTNPMDNLPPKKRYKAYFTPINPEDETPIIAQVPRSSLYRLRMRKELEKKDKSDVPVTETSFETDDTYFEPPDTQTDCRQGERGISGDIEAFYEPDSSIASDKDQEGNDVSPCSEEEEEEGDQPTQTVLHSWDSDEDSGGEDESAIVIVDDEQNISNAPVVRKGFEKLREVLEKTYGSVIDEVVLCSRGDLILELLATAKKHRFSNQAFLDVLNIINSMFRTPILPDTQYKVDKLLFSKDMFSYFFFCSECFHSLGQLDHKKVKCKVCPICGHQNQVSDLCNAFMFVIADLRLQLELLFFEYGEHFANDSLPSNDSAYRDLYDGSEYRKFLSEKPANERWITLDFCVDGTPVYKSSNTSIWPISVVVNELPPDLRMKNVLLGGLWFCRKPVMDVFLEPFARSLSKAKEEGVELIIASFARKVFIKTLGACLDSGARGPAQGVSLHNGEFGCNWCLNPGLQIGSARKYLGGSFDYAKRTMEDIIAAARELLHAKRHDLRKPDGKPIEHIRGVRSVSPLLSLSSFNIVNGMVVDFLHACSLGLARRLLTVMLFTAGKDSYIGEPNKRTMMIKRFEQLTPPRECRALPRSWEAFAHWKGREFDLFTLLFSPAILDGMLFEKPEYLKHWLLFVEAMNILLSDCITQPKLEAADAMLKKFHNDLERLYGIDEMTFNAHLVGCHLVENVRRFGPLFAISGYCFEAFNGDLKGTIHANRGIHDQIGRSISHDVAMSIIKTSLILPTRTKNFLNGLTDRRKRPPLVLGNVKLYGRQTPYNATTEQETWLWSHEQSHVHLNDCCSFRKAYVTEPGFCVEGAADKKKASARTNNAYVKLRDGRSFCVDKIIADLKLGAVFALGHEIQTVSFMPSVCPELARNNELSQRKIVRVHEDLSLVPFDNFKTIECLSKVEGREYLVTLPNLYNKC